MGYSCNHKENTRSSTRYRVRGQNPTRQNLCTKLQRKSRQSTELPVVAALDPKANDTM